MAVRHGVHLEVTRAQEAPALAVHAVALRQILLCLLAVPIGRAPDGKVAVDIKASDWHVEVEIRGFGSQQGRSTADDAVGLDMAHRLARTCGGHLSFRSEESAFTASVTMPALGQLRVLVVEDNADTVRLLRRYVSGTRYQIVGASTVEQALTLAREISPQIVILDVMMPETDGWEALGRLRQHPLTSHVPIVVCTILTQEELAISLGASDFVHKPVSRRIFLSALDRQACPVEPGSQ